MKTSKLIGFFDVRVYKDNIDRDKRPVKGQNDNITFNVLSNQPLEGLENFATKKERKLDNGEVVTKYIVKFKIGANTKWYDASGKLVDKPLYCNLDGKKYEAIIDFNYKQKVADNPLSPSGCWVNAIMYNEVANNPFEGMTLTPINDTHCTSSTTVVNDEEVANNEFITQVPEDLPF